MIVTGIHEAKTHLSRFLKQVERGEEVYIKRGNITIAKLVPCSDGAARKRPSAGTATSAPVTLSQDAFDPLSDEDLHEWGI